MSKSITKIRLIENIHVLLWLIKDLSWAMEFKFIGTIMIIPTLLTAIYILLSTRHLIDFWVNLSVLFWIIANATWMVVEFYSIGNKYYALPFFCLGLLSFFTFLYIYFKEK